MTRLTSRLTFASGIAAAAFGLASNPAQAAISCADLANLKIAASDIGLPSSGATISSAQIQTVPADPTAPGATREYCKVLGAIPPVDPNAPPVNFEVNLPTQWNGKAVQYGGGGTNGTLITGLGALRDARRDTPVPIARGFATWGTDSGHQNAKLPEPQAFALERGVARQYGLWRLQEDARRGPPHRRRVLRSGACENLLFRRLGRRPRSPDDGATLPGGFRRHRERRAGGQLYGHQSGAQQARRAAAGRRLDEPCEGQDDARRRQRRLRHARRPGRRRRQRLRKMPHRVRPENRCAARTASTPATPVFRMRRSKPTGLCIGPSPIRLRWPTA